MTLIKILTANISAISQPILKSKPVLESWDYKLSNEPTIIKIGQGLTNFLTLTLILTGLASGLGLDLGLTLASISQPFLNRF